MKPGRSVKYGVGCIIVDFILIVEAIINIRTGRITGIELFTIIVLSIVFATLLVALIKKNMRKKRDQYKSTRTEVQESTGNTEE